MKKYLILALCLTINFLTNATVTLYLRNATDETLNIQIEMPSNNFTLKPNESKEITSDTCINGINAIGTFRGYYSFGYCSGTYFRRIEKTNKKYDWRKAINVLVKEYYGFFDDEKK